MAKPSPPRLLDDEAVAVPTVLREAGYRFFFFSNEREEPPHVHVQQAERYAKFWLEPVRLELNVRFRRNELTKVRKIILDNREVILRAWHEHFGK
jgi:hypothetical protein